MVWITLAKVQPENITHTKLWISHGAIKIKQSNQLVFFNHSMIEAMRMYIRPMQSCRHLYWSTKYWYGSVGDWIRSCSVSHRRLKGKQWVSNICMSTGLLALPASPRQRQSDSNIKWRRQRRRYRRIDVKKRGFQKSHLQFSHSQSSVHFSE